MSKKTYFVKAVKKGFVRWQGYQVARSEQEAIESAKMYVAADKGAKWTAVEV